MNKERAFTLIEVVIYIAIFSIMMSGVIIAIYGIFGATARNQTKALVQDEGNFILSKIEWILTGIEIASVGGNGLNDNSLLVTKEGTFERISVALVGSDMMITRNPPNPSQSVNNSLIKISCDLIQKCFIYHPPSEDENIVENVEVHFTVSATTSEGLSYSQDFYTIKYMRK